MRFKIVFRYVDGEDFEVEVHPDDMTDFMECLGKGEVYFNKYRGSGLWISMEKVRYFQVEHLDEKGNRIREIKEKPKEELEVEEVNEHN